MTKLETLLCILTVILLMLISYSSCATEESPPDRVHELTIRYMPMACRIANNGTPLVNVPKILIISWDQYTQLAPQLGLSIDNNHKSYGLSHNNIIYLVREKMAIPDVYIISWMIHECRHTVQDRNGFWGAVEDREADSMNVQNEYLLSNGQTPVAHNHNFTREYLEHPTKIKRKF